jgi:sialate O-acetylesterase
MKEGNHMSHSYLKMSLPRFISDGMVMQRNTQVRIWGWAPVGENITVHFIDKVYSAIVNEEGEWYINIPTENAGGPYDMVLENNKGTDKITIQNILLGDVWLCSGQSNMEMRMESVRDTYAEEIAGAFNDSVRQFMVPQKYDFEKNLSDYDAGVWEAVTPQSIMQFTAVGYFFARKLFEKYHIPIGLINASLGGSPAEAWLSEESLRVFPEYLETAKKLRDKNNIEEILKKDEESLKEWYRLINQKDTGLEIEGASYFEPNYDSSAWSSIPLPSYWEEEGAGHFNGVVWFRREVELSGDLDNPAKLYLGNIIDEDTVYINGTQIGTTPMQYIPRKYDIPEGLLKEGRNTIVIRVVNFSGKGGFYKGKPYCINIGNQTIDLSGEWQYKIGVKCEPLPAPTFVQWGPSGLYNAMLAPMIPYALKGAIWYQGESNTQKPQEYESLLKTLITNWRDKWGQEDLPFLYVQLPNFMEASDKPMESSWAELRESQRKTLALPSTGMAVTIDLGECNDIHPVNKKDVGDRLALAAQRIVYGDKNVIAAGPMVRFAKKDGDRIILFFKETGSGLVTKDGKNPGHFAIAGQDKDFQWAETKLEGDNVVVWNRFISEPVYVRYAWADNPVSANLYNKEGLPASPFMVNVE